jgi:phosphoglycerate dehydrogenase-like enzyme
MVKGIIVPESALGIVYGDAELAEIAELIELVDAPQKWESVLKNPAILQEAEVLMLSWGKCCLNDTILEASPNLKAVFYAGGSIRGLVSDSFWRRNILISSAFSANAVPVAQYTISQIFACLKGLWRYSRAVKTQRGFPARDSLKVAGGYRSVVGLISLGMIARQVCRYLKAFDDISVIAYDPCVDEEMARELNVKLCSLEDVFRLADVVSLHTPLLEETEGLLGREQFLLMKPNSSFINTARGAIIREHEMIEVLQKRPDITAVLDVFHPEPPVSDSPLYDMENVILTPHIAGSLGPECSRMGKYMVEELRRYLANEPLQWAITQEQAVLLA